jgi:hypothetical protein
MVLNGIMQYYGKEANHSLDHNIDNILGRPEFEKQLFIYKTALKEVEIHCATEAIDIRAMQR